MLAAKPRANICRRLKGELEPRNGLSMYSNDKNAAVVEPNSAIAISTFEENTKGRCLLKTIIGQCPLLSKIAAI